MSNLSLQKYLVFAKIAARQEFAYRATLVGRLLLFVVLLLIFSNLWRVIFASSALKIENPAALLWYLFVTECIVLSAPRLARDIEDDIRSGNVAYRLTRPIPYHFAMLAQGLGTLLVRVFYIGLIGGGFTCLFTGAFPQSLAALAWLVVLIPCSVTVLLLFDAGIGVAAFWLQESTPLWWVWQKLLFILGGLMFPLSIYPEWLRSLAELTPFYALLYGCARLMLHYDPAAALQSLLLLVFWGIAAALILHFLYRAAIRSLTINGG